MSENSLRQRLRLPAVESLTGLSKSTIYRLESKDLFPRRIKLSARATAWRADEVLAWLDSRPRAA